MGVASLYYWATRVGQGLENCSPDDLRDECDTALPVVNADEATVRNVLQVVFAVLGAVAVIYIIIASITLVTSGGESPKIAKARETIIYALVGLVIAISAELLVTFLMGRV